MSADVSKVQVAIIAEAPIAGVAKKRFSMALGVNARTAFSLVFAPIVDEFGWERGLSEQQEQAVSFSPWHGLVAHQPIGGVNRVRKPTYERSVQFRGERNGCPVHELRAIGDLPAKGMTID